MFSPTPDPVSSLEQNPASPLLATLGHGPGSAADAHEERRFGRAFGVSATVHVLALALLVGFTLAVSDRDEDRAVFELVPVAGEGDDFMATEAPAGSEAGQGATGEIEFPMPESVPSPTPPAPAPMEAVPPPSAAVDMPAPNFKQVVKDKLRQEKRKVDREIKKQRAVEAAAAKAAEAKRKTAATSYEQFQKQNAPKTSAKSTGATATSPGKRIDASSIKKGVTGGTGAGSTGAGGTALSRAEANAMDAYFGMLIQRLRDGHEKPAGLSDLLNAEVQFTVSANGTISGARITRSSGNGAFDQSVLDTFGRVKMPARPDKATDVQRLTFRIREAE